MWQRVQQAMRVRQVVAMVVGLTFGLLSSFLSNWVERLGGWAVVVVAVVFLLSLAVSAWFWWRAPDRVMVRVQPPMTLRTDAEKQHAARAGLIAFVSLYYPVNNPQLQSQEPEIWLEAAQRLDYDALDLPSSNLGPLIEAVTTHASRLQHCWLVGTSNSDPTNPGSSIYIPVLIEYLRNERGMDCEFHHEGYEVSLDDDALVFSKTLKLIEAINRQADELGLDRDEILTDFTSGIRSLSLGAILASLDGRRDLELIGTHYASDGRPTGELFPIIFSFEPILQDA